MKSTGAAITQHPTPPTPSRSRIMRAIRGKDTGPELIVRRMLHAMGYRYRVHDRHLPGTPDLSFPRRRRVIFVHGCFCHQHDAESCTLKKGAPRSNTRYWAPKMQRTRARDAEHLAALERDGWQVMLVWECETTDRKELASRLTAFLGPPRVAHAARPSAP